MKIFLFAGEKSGDQLGGYLAKSLNGHTLVGVPGPLMRDEGVTTWLPMESFQVMGFKDILFALPRFFYYFHWLKRRILKEKPDIAVFIDYPGFNLRLEKSLRRAGFKGKLVHYVSPSVWAHGVKRAHLLDQTVDLLLSILPFEREFYQSLGCKLPVHYVGHPLIQEISQVKRPQKRKAELALFPGSRISEIRENFPKMMEAAKQMDGFQVTVSAATPEIEREILQLMGPLDWELIPGEERHEQMARARLAFATCGTVTLELALLETPAIACYHLNRINRFVAKYILKVEKDRFFALPNIIAGKELMPELIDKKFTTDSLVKTAKALAKKGKTQSIYPLMDQAEDPGLLICATC